MPTIVEIADVFNGKTPSKAEQRNGGLPILKIRDIDENGKFTGVFGSYVDAAFYKKYSNKKLRAGDTIILNAAHSADYVGNKNALVSEDLDGTIATGEWLIVRPKTAYSSFVNHFLKSPEGRQKIKKEVKGIHLYPKDVERIQIPLPSSDDQIRIAKLLSRVEAMIATRKNNLHLLDEFLKSTFLEMFGDPVRNEKGWDTTTFSKIGQFFSGGTPSKKIEDFWKGQFPWVSPKDMKVPYLADAQDHISEKVFEKTPLKRISAGHLLIVVRGMILAHSFPIAINTVPITINQDMKAILPNVDNVYYLMACLSAMKRQILTLISSAAHGTKRFDSLSMEKLFVPSPPLKLQNKFATIVFKVDSLKILYQQNLSELENLYGILSQKAFKGELDLSRIPLDKKDSVSSVSSVVNTKKEELTATTGYA